MSLYEDEAEFPAPKSRAASEGEAHTLRARPKSPNGIEIGIEATKQSGLWLDVAAQGQSTVSRVTGAPNTVTKHLQEAAASAYAVHEIATKSYATALRIRKWYGTLTVAEDPHDVPAR